MAMLLLCCAALLSACQSKGPNEVRIATYEVPKSLLTCKNPPQKPQGNYKQRQVASYVTRLYGAYEDCKQKLSRVDKLLDAQQARVGAEKP